MMKLNYQFFLLYKFLTFLYAVISSSSLFTCLFVALTLGIESLLKSMAYLQHTAPTEGNKENLSLVRGMSLTLASMGMTINRAMVSVV